jgi:hypothetical protein
MTAAFVANRDVAIVIAARLLELRLKQGSVGLAFVQMLARDLDHGTLAGAGRFHLDDCHD